jgi:hypothetical protein
MRDVYNFILFYFIFLNRASQKPKQVRRAAAKKMRYRWKPNSSQRAAFAERMKDPEEKAAYEERKHRKANYDYWKDKDFVPTQMQYEFCTQHRYLFITSEEQDACNQVEYGFGCNEKIPHSYIHVVNEIIRSAEARHLMCSDC